MDILFFINLFITLSIGLVLGSFATALAYRIPAGVSWSFQDFSGKGLKASRSACPHCHRVLGVLDLIPLFSWIFIGGRCRSCKAAIGYIYPLTEVIAAMGCIGIFLAYGMNVPSLLMMAAVPFLTAHAVIDFKHFQLPDSLNVIIALIGCGLLLAGYCPWREEVSLADRASSSVLGLAGFGFFAWCLGKGMSRLLHKDTLGLGDVKFFMVAGLWLGISALPLFLILSGILGVIVGFIYRILTNGFYFPFGPALILAFYTILIAAGFLRHVNFL